MVGRLELLFNVKIELNSGLPFRAYFEDLCLFSRANVLENVNVFISKKRAYF